MVTPLRIVLLGGTGFCGSAVLRRLRREPGAEVRALVRRSARRLPGVAALQGTLAELPPGLFFDDPHVVVHLATKQVDRDGTGFEVNVETTRRLLASLPPSCRGVVYGSSISVYGRGAQRDLAEGAPVRPATPLARSRARAEQAILAGAPAAIVLRPRFVLGRGDRFTLPGLLELCRRRVAVGRGDQGFSVIDVDDYAEVIVRAAARLLAGPPVRQVLHVGYARPLAMLEITAALRRTYALPPPLVRVPVGERLVGVLDRLPFAGARALATRLELVGLPHHVAVDGLRRLAPEVAARDPRAALEGAVSHLSGAQP